MLSTMTAARAFRFTITVVVDSDQEGYDDPEWIADAAWGALSNEYGYKCSFGRIEEVVETSNST
jgi:hypothetical protein